MCAIGRALMELLGVLAAGFVGFFVVLVYMVGGLIWFACGVVCFCFLLVVLFSMVMWLSTHDAHAFHVVLGYFVYAGAAYALVAAMSYYRGKFSYRLSFGRTGKLPLAESPAVRSPGMRALSLCCHRSGVVLGPSLTYDHPGGNPGQCP